MKIIKTYFDQEHHTQFYNIEEVSNWGMEHLLKLLRAEKLRSKAVSGSYRGPSGLLELLEEADIPE